jgi:hypothetical protein
MRRCVIFCAVLAIAAGVGAADLAQLEELVTNAKAAYVANPSSANLAELEAAVEAFQYALPASVKSSKGMATETEPNDTPATANTSPTGDYVVANISPAGDVDYFVAGGNAVSDLVYAAVNTSNTSSGTDSQINVFANDGTTLIEFDDDGGPGLASCVAGGVVPQAGDVYLVPNEYGNNGEITPYELHWVVAPASDFANETEPNDTFATATPITATFMAGDISAAAPDIDFFSFSAAAGNLIHVIVDEDPDGNGSNLDTELDLLDTDGITVLAAGDDGITWANNCAGTAAAPTTGTYFVRLSDGGTSPDNDYRFTVIVEGAAVPVELVGFSIE